MVHKYTTAVTSKKIKNQSGNWLQVGAVVYKFVNEELQILLISSRRRQRPIVPKGWPQPGCTLAQSAINEVFEEAGVIGTAEPYPFATYNYQKDYAFSKATGLIDVELFKVKFIEQATEWPEKNQRESCWLAPKDAAQLVDNQQLKDILCNFKVADS